MKLNSLSEQYIYENQVSDYWKALNSQTKRAWGKVAQQIAKYKEARSILAKIEKGHTVSYIEKDYLKNLIDDTMKGLRMVIVLPMGIPIYMILHWVFKKYMVKKLEAI